MALSQRSDDVMIHRFTSLRPAEIGQISQIPASADSLAYMDKVSNNVESQIAKDWNELRKASWCVIEYKKEAFDLTVVLLASLFVTLSIVDHRQERK